MKKLFKYSLLLLIVLLISSCGKSNSASPSVSPSNAPTASSPSASPSASPSPSNSSSNAPTYLGDWTVRSLVGSTPISAEVDESFIGMKAIYTNDKASFGKDEILNPEYKEQDITNDDFFNEYRNHLSDIGIESESVKTVSINNWTHAGSVLIIKDDQTMIFLWDGNYYEMKKEK